MKVERGDTRATGVDRLMMVGEEEEPKPSGRALLVTASVSMGAYFSARKFGLGRGLSVAVGVVGAWYANKLLGR